MQITKQDIKNLRKGMGLTAHDITKIFDCTEKTVYNKEKPADEPADLVWYYALRWVEIRHLIHTINSGEVDEPVNNFSSGEEIYLKLDAITPT